MKRIQMAFFGLAMTFGAACDGVIGDEPGVVASALRSGGTTAADDVVVDGQIITAENPASATRRPTIDPGYVLTAGGDVEVVNDFAVEDEGPGVVKDCSASATECKATCTLVGNGSCEATTHSATCTLVYDCGGNLCETSTTVNCID